MKILTGISLCGVCCDGYIVATAPLACISAVLHLAVLDVDDATVLQGCSSAQGKPD